MEQSKQLDQPHGLSDRDAAVERDGSKKPYVAPHLHVLDVEATRNGPGAFPDAGVDYS